MTEPPAQRDAAGFPLEFELDSRTAEAVADAVEAMRREREPAKKPKGRPS